MSDTGAGVNAEAISGVAFRATSANNFAIYATSQDADTINATANSAGHAGVSANNSNTSGGFGVWAKARTAGHFESSLGYCVEAMGTADIDAIDSTTSSPNHAALAGHNNGGGFGLWVASDTKTGQVGGIGIYARGATHAAQFDGHIQHNGDVHHAGTVYAKTDVVLGSDCVEDFEIDSATDVEPGT